MVGALRAAVIAAACLLLILSGCRDTPDSLMKSQIRTINKMAAAMENKRPASEIDDLRADWMETVRKLNALEMSSADRMALLQKYSSEMGDAMLRLNKATLGRAADGLESLLPKK